MGKVHTEGIRRLGNVEVAGIAASTIEKAREFADQNNIPNATGDYRTLLAARGRQERALRETAGHVGSRGAGAG
jgi:predicted dehydrogenase